MKIKNVVSKVVAAGSVVSSSLYLVSAAFAQNAGQYIGGINSAGSGDLLSFLKSALNLVISLSALVAVGILVYSGIQYIVAAGDEGKVEKATKGITYAIVGLVVCFVSVLIVNFVLTNLLKV
jgi:cytochrome bd-type quinol oxidase subunit 2